MEVIFHGTNIAISLILFSHEKAVISEKKEKTFRINLNVPFLFFLFFQSELIHHIFSFFELTDLSRAARTCR